MKKIQTLKDLTSNILETMFFLIQETQPEADKQNFKYAVNIKDTRVDIIILYCERTARQMTENFMGTEGDEIETQDIHDTLKESINIIAGNFIGTELSDVTNKIHIPTVIDKIESITETNYEQALLYYNEEPVKILLRLD